MCSQEMDLDPVLMDAELDPGHEAEPEAIRRGLCLGDAGERVVIGERESDDAGAMGRFDGGGRRRSAIRGRRVRVQVDVTRRRGRVTRHGA